MKTFTNTNVTKDSTWTVTKTPRATQARANGLQCHFVKKRTIFLWSLEQTYQVCIIISNLDETMNNKISFISVHKCSPLVNGPPVNGKREIIDNYLYRFKCDEGFATNGNENVTCNPRTGLWSEIPN